MTLYLQADGNREDITSHNENLVVTVTKQVGRNTFTSYDFNKEEEFRRLDALLAMEDAESLTDKTIAKQVYGTDDAALVKRVRNSLKYASPYQRTLTNGRAVIARPDGTLRITRNADEFGDLVEENTAAEVDRMDKYVDRSTNRLNRNLNIAVNKVPELEERLGQTRQEAHTVLSSVFSRKLELLAGGN